MDHDIHPHRLGDSRTTPKVTVDFARGHLRRVYGDLLASIVVLEIPNPGDAAAVGRLLEARRLEGRLELARVGFAFWNPDGGDYRSKTTPKSRPE